MILILEGFGFGSSIIVEGLNTIFEKIISIISPVISPVLKKFHLRVVINEDIIRTKIND